MLLLSTAGLLATAGIGYALCLARVFREARGTATAERFDGAPPTGPVVVPGFALRKDGGLRPDFESRLAGALRLGGDRIILVGGTRAGADMPSEAAAGSAWLTARGVPPDAIRCETASRTRWRTSASCAT